MQELALLEKVAIMAEAPKDLNGAATTGARIKLDKGFRLAIIVNMAASTGATVSFTLKQHDAASSGNSKVLAISNAYYKKVGTGVAFTKVEPTSPQSNFVLSSDFAASAGVVVFEINVDDLDCQNDFAWVSLDIANATASKYAGVTHVVHNLKQLPGYEIAL